MKIFELLLMVSRSFLGYLLKTSLIKWAVFFALYFLVVEMMPFIKDLVFRFLDFQPIFNTLPSEFDYFLTYLSFEHGFNLIISAYLVRFIIRRIPVVG